MLIGLAGGLVLAILIVGLFIVLSGDDTTTYQVPSDAMKPTLSVGDEISVNVGAYADEEPEIGDVVVVHPPLNANPAEQERGEALPECAVNKAADEACPEPGTQMADVVFVKRVVAGPGDTLSIRDGHAVVNGVEADEDFTTPCRGGSGCNLPQQITIPPERYFMMGDNRGASDDSRFWGPVPPEWIVGRVED